MCNHGNNVDPRVTCNHGNNVDPRVMGNHGKCGLSLLSMILKIEENKSQHDDTT